MSVHDRLVEHMSKHGVSEPLTADLHRELQPLLRTAETFSSVRDTYGPVEPSIYFRTLMGLPPKPTVTPESQEMLVAGV